VAALRTDERGTDPSLAGSADVEDLVEEYRRAGLVIEASIGPAATSPEGPVGTAVHRIAREALANIARHAPSNRVELRIDTADAEVRLLVADHGRPAEPPDTGAGHFGLVGMRERARALGGDLEAEPSSDGWRVTARLPLAAASRDQVLRP
jgi:signal transduction histidine kinase